MADKNKFVIEIGGDAKGFVDSTKSAVSALKDVVKNTEKFGSVGSAAFSSFLGNISANAVSSAFSAIQDGLSKSVALVKEFSAAGAVQEDSINKVNEALVRTGQYSPEASKGLQKYASDLQEVSTVGDEVILNNIALIQSLAELDERGLKRATKGALDLAAATGIPFEKASKVVAQAAEGNVEALKRFNIYLESSGDNTVDFTNALDQLERKFSGAAKAATYTFSGALIQTNNLMGDLGEEIGAAINQTPALIGVIRGAGDVFKYLMGVINENKVGIQSLVTGGVMLAIDGIQLLSDTFQGFVNLKAGVSDFFSSIEDFGDGAYQTFIEISNGALKAQAAVQEFFGKSSEGTRAAIKENQDLLKSIDEERMAREEATFKAQQEADAKNAAVQEVTDTVKSKLLEQIEAQKNADDQLENSRLIRNEQAIVDKEAQNQLLLDLQATHNEAYFQLISDNLGQVQAEELRVQLAKLEQEKKYDEAKRLVNAKRVEAEKNAIFTVRKYEELTNKERLANLQGTLGAISSLTSSSNSELFAIGKAAAISTATIDGIAAVQKALASAPPPFNIALAALVGVATAANVTKIASAKPPTGAANGAFVSSGVYGKDTEPFLLSKGEIVAPDKSFDEVVEGTARERGFVKPGENTGGGDLINELRAIRELLSSRPPVVVQGDFLSDEVYITRLAERLQDMMNFRGLTLGEGNGFTNTTN